MPAIYRNPVVPLQSLGYCLHLSQVFGASEKNSFGLIIPSGLIASTALEAACPQQQGEVKHTQSSLQLRPKKR